MSDRDRTVVRRFVAVLGALFLVLLALVIVLALRVAAPRAAVVAGSLLLLGTAAAAATGPKLRWEQVALRAVTVGTDVHGVVDPPSEVAFFVVGGRAVEPGAYGRFVWLHLVVLPLLVLVLGVVVWRAARFGVGNAEGSVPDDVAVAQ